MIEELTFRFSGRYGNNIVQLANILHIHLNLPNSFISIPDTRKNNIRPKIIDYHQIYHRISDIADSAFCNIDTNSLMYIKTYISNIYFWNKHEKKHNIPYLTFEDRINQLPILTKDILELEDTNSQYDDDLLIHIRSTDIYKQHTSKSYAQPPLSFYHTIIQNHQFNKIYIVSDNNNNFVVNALKIDYGNRLNIIEEPNTKNAFNILRNAKNVCTSTSSFCTMSTFTKPLNRTKNIFTYEYLCYKPGVWHYDFMFDSILKRPSYNFFIYRINNYPFMKKINNQFIGNWSFTPATQKIMESHNMSDISRIQYYEYR